MSSQQFEDHEDDFRTLYDDLKEKLSERVPKVTGEARKRLIRGMERGIEDAHLLIQDMERELRQAPSHYKTQMVSRMRMYKRDLEQLEKDVKRATSSTGPGVDNYGFARTNELDRMQATQRNQLLTGTESLNRATDSIARSHRVAAETDQIGTDIIDELGTQRESLVRTRDRLEETDSNLSKSRKILNSMARRVMTNKLILVVIIILEVGVLGGVVYWKFFS